MRKTIILITVILLNLLTGCSQKSYELEPYIVYEIGENIPEGIYEINVEPSEKSDENRVNSTIDITIVDLSRLSEGDVFLEKGIRIRSDVKIVLKKK